MPVVDANGNASNSWLLYKVLIAVPTPEPVDAGTGAPDATVDSDAEAVDGAATDAAATDAGTASADASAPADGGAEDAGSDAGATMAVVPPVDVSQVHAPFALTDMPEAERATLANYILGQPMPVLPSGSTSTALGPLTLEQLERVSLWITQGAQTPTACTSSQ